MPQTLAALPLICGGEREQVSEAETEPTEPTVTDVPEPDQDPQEPTDEEAEAEEAETPEEPEEPVASSPQDDKQIEIAFTSLQKEATRHANRISQIMGEDANLLQPCPRCVTTDPQRPATPGFIWPHEMVPLLPADKAAVKLSIGEGAGPTYKTNDDAYQCPKCGGEGEYETGSKKRGQILIACDQCSSRGWIGQRALSATTVTPNGTVSVMTTGAQNDEPRPDADPWGRLRDDPLYGVMPGFER